MPSGDISSIDVILYPELIASALLNKEGDLYALWSVLKSIDKHSQGKGIGKLSGVLDVCADILGVSRNYVYAKIKQGIGKYWRQPSGKNGEKVIALFSWGNVVKRLQPELPRCEPFTVKCYHLFTTKEESNYLKSLFVGMVAARLGSERPISIASICKATGLSRATVYSCLNQCVGLTKITNYALIQVESENDLVFVQRNLMNEGKKMYRIAHQESGVRLLKRLPNAYSLDYERAPVKKRPEALKAYDADNAANCSKRKYANRGKNKGLCEFVESTNIPELGKIRIWQDKGQLPIEINGPKTRKIFNISE